MSAPRILIVDDEEAIVETLSFRLAANGYEVLKAGDGEAGLAAARAERPDVILLDVMMPKMTGDVVCKALKADPQYRQIPIIMLTAKSQEADRAHGLACGADAYMGKPFESKALLAAIQQQLERAAEQQS